MSQNVGWMVETVFCKSNDSGAVEHWQFYDGEVRVLK